MPAIENSHASPKAINIRRITVYCAERICTVTILGLDTVAVVVSDRRKAIQWYHDVLGLPIAYVGPSEPSTDPSIQGTVENPGHWIELGSGRPLTRVHLCELSDHRTEPGPTGITFLTDNIQIEYERLRSRGVRFLYPPRKMDWGEWLCEFADPDGNEFDLKQPVESGKWAS
jgi:catechol 2,3-dioxygenase-like lactoylglutathione lyase family enzyme